MEKETIGDLIYPTLEKIENTLWEFDHKPNYPKNSLRAATKIFMSVMADKMYDLQTSENISLEDKGKMATKMGEDIRQMIKTYTGVESYDFYK